MTSFSVTAVIIICNIVLTFNGLSNGALVRRFNYDARLYEHFAYDSRYVQYSRTNPELWMNLTALTEARNFTFQSMICTFGPGAWIFYPEPNYGMGNRQIYYLIIGEHCIRGDDVYSIQPLGKMDEYLDQGVLLFSKIHFGSPATLVENMEGSGEGQSMIFTGGESFMLSGGSAKYCVTPEDVSGYCVIPDLSALKIEGSATINANCTDDVLEDSENTIRVHNCYDDGVHEIYHDADMSAAKIREVCSGSGSQFDKGKFTIVMDMWAKRMGKDYLGKRAPSPDPDENLKLNVIWNVIDTFARICPTIDTIYAYLLGNLIEIHLKNAWGSMGSKEPAEGAEGAAGTNSTNDDAAMDEWMMVLKWTQYCKKNVQGIVNAAPTCKMSDKTGAGVEKDSTFGDEWYAIVNGHEFDPVLEQMWLIINAFIPACAQAQDFGTNDWNDMILFFNENFLSPLADVWSTPEDWRRVYTAVFHGYDIREEHQDVLDCLKGVLISTPAFDPLGRPQGFREHVTYSYLLPMFGEIAKTKGKEEKKEEGGEAKVEKRQVKVKDARKSPKS